MALIEGKSGAERDIRYRDGIGHLHDYGHCHVV
jgi:hypothetical protein